MENRRLDAEDLNALTTVQQVRDELRHQKRIEADAAEALSVATANVTDLLLRLFQVLGEQEEERELLLLLVREYDTNERARQVRVPSNFPLVPGYCKANDGSRG